MKKRILPALLALCMVISLLPVMAFAAENDKVSCKNVPTAGAVVRTATETGDYTDDQGQKTEGVSIAVTVKAGTVAANGHTGSCATANCTCYVEGATTKGKVVRSGEAGSYTYTREDTVNYTFTMCDACKANATCNPCTGQANCTAKVHTAKWGNDHNTKCAAACTVDGCFLTANHNEKHQGTACTKEQSNTNKCPASVHDASCGDKCTVEGCTKTVGHKDAHSVKTCTGDANCAAPAGSHKSTGFGQSKDQACPKYVACEFGKVAADAQGAGGDAGCTLDKGHSGAHNNTVCGKGANCGASTHDAKCPSVCGIGGCLKTAGHKDAHDSNQTTCLGYANDTRCNASTHISGCPNFHCACWYLDESGQEAEWKPAHEGCTGKPGCPACAALESCDCPVCAANPAMGAVVDENGNPVDPAEPTEPTTPKAEDFTDMEDWMVADVQVALDKGWLQGNGDGKFEGRVATTGAAIANVVARMTGEGDFTGANWWGEAMEWASGSDAFEGLELYPTGPMARKDLVLVIWRLAGKQDSEFELTFTDVDGLEGDHLTAMKWAVENGIVKGNGDGTVTPDGSVSRAALCAMLARYDSLEK